MTGILVRAAAAAWLVVQVSACSTVSASQSQQQPGLDGTSWVLSSLPGRELVAPSQPTLQFAGDRVSGSDGCNRFGGRYATGTASLEFGQLASTQMACSSALMEQAKFVNTALSGARSYRIDGDRLELLGDHNQVLATYTAQSTQLAGTQWRATGINNGKGGVASLVANTSVTLDFGSDGQVSGSAGCNRYTAGYEAGRDTLKFNPAAVTRKMCSATSVMEQEQAYLNALARVTTARREGDRLELRDADGALAAVFNRAGTD